MNKALITGITAVGTGRILEALRETRMLCKFYQASTSEMFGKAQEKPPESFGGSR
jgi:GDPmannose 4,6-dehydratase